MTPADRSRMPAPGEPRAFVFPRAGKRKLASGLSVWAVERRSLPLVTLVLVIPAGSAADPAGRAGLAAMTADMLDEGSGGRSAIEIHESLVRLGTALDTGIGADAVELSLTVLDRFVPDALRLLSEIVVHPALSTADVERVRVLRMHRLLQLRSVPVAGAEAVFLRAIYGDQAYGHLPQGSSASLTGLGAEEVAAFHRTHYDPGRATLVCVGAVRPDAFARAADDAFGSWRANVGGTADERPAARAPLPEATARILLVDRPGAAQTELRVGHVGAARRIDEYPALVLLNAVLGGHFMSRLNANLRERRGFTYGVRSSFDLRRMPGPFAVQTSVQTDATAEAVSEILAELEALRGARPAAPHELALSSSTLTRGYARNFETAGQVARGLAQLALLGLPDDTFETFVPRIEAVREEDLLRAAGVHLRPHEAVVVAVGDGDRIRSALNGLGLGAPAETVPDL